MGAVGLGRAGMRGGLIVVGAVLASFGMVGAAGAAPCDSTEEMAYVALGDSYSAGFGLSDATGDCNRSGTKNHPKLLQSSLGFDAFVDVSCSEARTDHFTGSQGSAPPQVDAIDEDTDIITFSIEGNDLGFTEILVDCATSGDCRSEYGGNDMPDLHAKIDNEVGPKIEAAMREAQAKAPNAQIFAIGYPDLLPASADGGSWALSCLPASAVISDAERTSLRGVQVALNDEIAERAAAVGGSVHYVDVYTESVGHDMCSEDPWVTQLTNLFHPSDLGHQEIGRILAEAIPGALDAACHGGSGSATGSDVRPFVLLGAALLALVGVVMIRRSLPGRARSA